VREIHLAVWFSCTCICTASSARLKVSVCRCSQALQLYEVAYITCSSNWPLRYGRLELAELCIVVELLIVMTDMLALRYCLNCLLRNACKTVG